MSVHIKPSMLQRHDQRNIHHCHLQAQAQEVSVLVLYEVRADTGINIIGKHPFIHPSIIRICNRLWEAGLNPT